MGYIVHIIIHCGTHSSFKGTKDNKESWTGELADISWCTISKHITGTDKRGGFISYRHYHNLYVQLFRVSVMRCSWRCCHEQQ